ncbi:MAG: hypothetical protein JOY83_17490 [Alphaproteobacteria bacterium]|nr:hypothetical protein [Alphaproteobacteria bacterium]
MEAKPSGKLPDTHSIGSIGDHDLGVFSVTKVAMKNTNPVTPAHSIPGTPNPADLRLQTCRAPRMPLTFLARLAAW